MRVSLPARPSILPGGFTWPMINNNVFGERVAHFRNVPVVKGKVKAMQKLTGKQGHLRFHSGLLF